MQDYVKRSVVERCVSHALFEERCGRHITTADPTVKTRLEVSYKALDNLKLDVFAGAVKSATVMDAWKTASFIFDGLARSLHADEGWWLVFECALTIVVMLLRQSRSDLHLITFDGDAGPEKNEQGQ